MNLVIKFFEKFFVFYRIWKLYLKVCYNLEVLCSNKNVVLIDLV